MQADAFSGYNALYAADRKPEPVVEAARWAHGRRDFFDLAKLAKAPIAAEIVRRIDKLFAIDGHHQQVARGASRGPADRSSRSSPRSRRDARATRAAVAEERSRQGDPLHANPIGFVTRFLDDEEFAFPTMPPNADCAAWRSGRNWTFAGSDEGGRRAAAVYSLPRHASSMTSMRALGSPTSSPSSPTILLIASTSSCPGPESSPRGRGPRHDRRRRIASLSPLPSHPGRISEAYGTGGAARGAPEPDLCLEEAGSRQRREPVRARGEWFGRWRGRARTRDGQALRQDRPTDGRTGFLGQEARSMSASDRRAMVERSGKDLSVRRQCALVGVARSGTTAPSPSPRRTIWR